MTFVSQLLPCLVLTLIQFAAALPWLWALDAVAVQKLVRRPATWLNVIGAILGVTLLGAFLLSYQRGSNLLDLFGRLYGSVLHLQLSVDLFVALFVVILVFWPKGGTVALAAFREGVRQPMFWLIGLAAVLHVRRRLQDDEADLLRRDDARRAGLRRAGGEHLDQ